MKDNLKAHDWEMLSAYLDGVLTPEETRLVKTRLSADVDWQAALLALTRTRGILRFVPKIKRRRNFLLTEDMVRRRSGFWLASTMNFSSIAAAILAVIFLLIDFLPLAVNPAAMAPQMESAPLMETTTEKLAGDGQTNAIPVEKKPDSMMDGIPEMVDPMPEITPAVEPGSLAAPPPAELLGEPSYSIEEVGEGVIGELDTDPSSVEPLDAGNIAAAPAPAQAVSGDDSENPTPTGLRSFAATATIPAEKNVPTYSPTPFQAKSGVETEPLATSSPDLIEPGLWTGQKNEIAPSEVTSFRLSDIALFLFLLSIILAATSFILKKALRD